MVTYIYKGEGERVFPTLGITVKQNETFEAPADFHAVDVIQVKIAKATTSKENAE